jgi:hypothetical protein
MVSLNEPTFVPGDGQTHAQTLLSKHVLNDVALTWIRSQTCVAQSRLWRP